MVKYENLGGRLRARNHRTQRICSPLLGDSCFSWCRNLYFELSGPHMEVPLRERDLDACPLQVVPD
ncbi:MAG: hypothetical protein GTN74_02520 [Proteobacteria bacterium]|nr:hypothetical protein [Pseudomonadota bacterium]NIS68052.1 hypothetical protein [Pseudomonadota bacterium]